MTEINLCNEVLENAIGVHRSLEKIEPLNPMDAVAVQAMEELLEYRAIGTVEELLCSKAKNLLKRYGSFGNMIDELEEYRTIGTVEEFEILKDKNRAKRVDKDDCCPVCLTYGKDDNGVEGDYCPNCGQKLDWGEE